MFSKRHYEVIASMVRETNSVDTGLVGEMIKCFQLDNPRFDTNRFIKACSGIKEND